MPILHVRNVPDELYSQLVERAQRQQRSISAEVIQLLGQALTEAPDQLASRLERIRRRRRQHTTAVAPDSVTLLREDRQR